MFIIFCLVNIFHAEIIIKYIHKLIGNLNVIGHVLRTVTDDNYIKCIFVGVVVIKLYKSCNNVVNNLQSNTMNS